jgi:hypothetical protein
VWVVAVVAVVLGLRLDRDRDRDRDRLDDRRRVVSHTDTATVRRLLRSVVELHEVDSLDKLLDNRLESVSPGPEPEPVPVRRREGTRLVRRRRTLRRLMMRVTRPEGIFHPEQVVQVGEIRKDRCRPRLRRVRVSLWSDRPVVEFNKRITLNSVRIYEMRDEGGCARVCERIGWLNRRPELWG